MDYYLWQIILVSVLVIITGYCAYQTRRQASLFDKKLRAMAEQRRKSIQTSLQIGKISHFYRNLEIEGTDKHALAPCVELHVGNV